MGFINKIIQLIKGYNYDEKTKQYSRRINELRQQHRDAKVKLDKLNSAQNDDSWYKITLKSSDKSSTDFLPPKLSIEKTMQSLLDERIKEEQRRLAELAEQTNKSLEFIAQLIDKEEAENATSLIGKCINALKVLNDDALWTKYRKVQKDLVNLKNVLLQREIARKEEEERIKREAEQRRLEAERLKREQEEAERRERIRRQQEYEEQLRLAAQKQAEEKQRLLNLVTRKKADSDRILDYLRQKGVQYFYHFTDERNISSIRKLGGLYSWQYSKEHNIVIPNAGGNLTSRNLDTRHGLQDYVRLSFCNDHPMAYRLHQSGATLVLLRIKIDVAAFSETQFSDVNAADDSVSNGPTLDDLRRVNISATQRNYVRNTDPDFKQHQAECMVKTFIPSEYILNLNNPQRMIFGR